MREVMIGGFALVVAPAEYGVSGVKTFIVSHDGVVYEKDFGPKILDELLNGALQLRPRRGVQSWIKTSKEELIKKDP